MTDLQPRASWTPGFYDDGHGMRRFWNGRAWTQDADPAHVTTSEVRARNLETAIARFVSAGWTIEYRSGEQAVLSRRLPMSVLANLLGVILTGGLWLIYILVRIASPRFERRTLTVHPNGTVLG